jgi:MoaA/NifB/PqqE/SkfB family radical SAM enzyme
MTGTVYSPLKVLRYDDRLKAMRENAPAAPVHVRIKPTNVCNHSCYFCAYRSDNVSLGDDMALRDRIAPDKMVEIVDDIIDMGVEAVTFSGGGEPLIYPGFADTVTRLGEAGIRIGCLSNGARLLGKPADAMARHGTWIRISIDGWDGPSYARYRGVKPDEFAKVMDNMSAFAARDSGCTLGASIIVDETNVGHILELTRQLKQVGARHAKISPCILSNDGAKNNAYHQPLMLRATEQIARARLELEDETFQVVDHYHLQEESFDKDYRQCPMTRLLTVIGADCEVYSCQDKAYTPAGKLGSIKDRRFHDFWLSEENRRALSAIDPHTVCGHHCVADTKNRIMLDYLDLDPDHAAFV